MYTAMNSNERMCGSLLMRRETAVDSTTKQHRTAVIPFIIHETTCRGINGDDSIC